MDGTHVSGVIKSRKLDDETFLGESSFTGKRRGYRIDGLVIKVSHLGVECYGDLRLDLRKNMLKLKGSKLVADFLPKEAVLWRDMA